MKNKLALLLAALLALTLAIPQAYAREITFNATDDSVWTLVVPDEFFENSDGEDSPDSTPQQSASPTPSAETTPSPSVEPTASPTATPAITSPPTPAKTPETQLTPEPTASPEATPGAQGCGSNVFETMMLTWVNAERAAQNLPALVCDPTLTRLARMKSQDMADLNYFSHTSPTYGSAANMLKTYGVPFSACAENIARYGSLYKAHVGLMSSAGHYANIMSKSMTRAGIGVVLTSSGTYYITQMFIR